MQRLFFMVFGLMAAGIVAGFLGTAAIGSDTSDETLCIPMGRILLEAPEGVDAKRSPVTFHHPVHYQYTCQTCHHDWAGEAEIVGCMTSGCHDLTESPLKAGATEPSETIRYYKNAYHELCIGCHMEINTRNREAERSLVPGRTVQLKRSGPTGCVQCHP